MQQRLLVVIVILLVLLALWPQQSVRAAPTVTVTDCSNTGLTNAIAAVDAGGTISFNCPGASPVIVISEKVLAKSLTIDGLNGGRGMSLSGGNLNRLFTIQAGFSVVLRNLSLANGQASGGELDGGAVLNYGTLLVENSRIVTSKAQPLAFGEGGGLANKAGGVATLVNTLVQGNHTRYGGGGLYNNGMLSLINSHIYSNTVDGRVVSGSVGGAGIYNNGTLTLTATTISENHLLATDAGHGAGIYHHGGTLRTYNSRIERNFMTLPNSGFWRGGGIYHNGGIMVLDTTGINGNRLNEFFSNGFGGGIYSNAVLTLTASSVMENQGNPGSGIYNATGANMYIGRSTIAYQNTRIGNQPGTGTGLLNDGSMRIESSTISRNYIGISNGNNNSTASVTLNNSTIAGNSYYQLGASSTANNQYTFKNTIVADLSSFGSPLTCGGTPASKFQSLGNNLENGTGCNFIQFSDQVNKDPKLEQLAHNGGPTLTHALLPDSPAINAGACPPGNPTTDQRGAERIVGVACDIGAFEFGAFLSRSFIPVVLRLYNLGW